MVSDYLRWCVDENGVKGTVIDEESEGSGFCGEL